MADTTLTWLGHAAFRIDTAGGKRIYVDPFLKGNPKCPEAEQEPERIDTIAVTHGHVDHVGDTVDLARKHGSTVVALVVTLTNAFHSGSAPDGSYAGEPSGIVVETENGTKLYFAGDTCVFGDMQLIGRIYEPDVAILPIGGHYTMDPREAAVALELLGATRCVPCHYGTFGLLTGTPDQLAELAPGVQIERLEPGGSVTI